MAGRLHGAGDSGDASKCGGGTDTGQASADEAGSAILIGVENDLRAPFCALAASLGTIGVDRDDRTTNRCPQLAGGLPASSGQHAVLDGAGGLVRQRGGGIGDDPGPRQVDLAGGQGGAGGWQLPAQLGGQPGPVHGGELSHGQRQRYLSARLGEHLDGPAVLVGAIAAERGAAGDLSHRGQLLRLSPGRQPPVPQRDIRQIGVVAA